MKAILKDGSEIECGYFKQSESGVSLFEEKKGQKIGFVPYDELRTIAPDDYEPKDRSPTIKRQRNAAATPDE